MIGALALAVVLAPPAVARNGHDLSFVLNLTVPSGGLHFMMREHALYDARFESGAVKT